MNKDEDSSKIIKSISEGVSHIIESVVDQFYSPESAGKIGKGLAEFYKALREGGISEEAALEMTQRYQSNLTLGGMERVCTPINCWGNWKNSDEKGEETPEDEVKE